MRFNERDGFEYGPEYWSIYDLGRPSNKCDMPPAVRTEMLQLHTCPHCNVRFILITAFEKDQPDGRKAMFWANFNDHTLMREANRKRMRLYEQDEMHFEVDYPMKWSGLIEENTIINCTFEEEEK